LTICHGRAAASDPEAKGTWGSDVNPALTERHYNFLTASGLRGDGVAPAEKSPSFTGQGGGQAAFFCRFNYELFGLN
jgi:hypothetical protein